MKCEYCNSELLSKASLAAHQKKAIYCIKEQQKIKGKTVEIQRNTHMCEGCEKQISSAHTARHRKTCKSLINLAENQTLRSENQTLKSELAIYKDLADKDRECIREIAKQPRVSNVTKNKIVLTPFDMTQARIKSIVDTSFTRNHLLEGQKGVAKFTVEYVLKDTEGKLMYMCTDPSRHSYKFVDENGEEIKDIKSRKLTEAIYPAVKEKSFQLVNEGISEQACNFPLYTESFVDIKGMTIDNSDFRAELAAMTS
jgi:hypothetical protein